MSTISNLDKYKNDLSKLISDGNFLELAMKMDCYPTETKEQLKRNFKDRYEETLKLIPSFTLEYQIWYSEALALIKLILPDRLSDFIKFYEKPKIRKDIDHGNYVIEDYLQGLTGSRGSVKIFGKESAIPKFMQQLTILKSAEKRFESSLFDIKQLVQADLYDSELETAKELLKKNFLRAAGAIAGVILEKHLKQVCENHNLTLPRTATINNLNELLKSSDVIDVPIWRTIQFLGDIRNLCDHSTGVEPTKAQVDDLIKGVEKLIKTLF